MITQFRSGDRFYFSSKNRLFIPRLAQDGLYYAFGVDGDPNSEWRDMPKTYQEMLTHINTLRMTPLQEDWELDGAL